MDDVVYRFRPVDRLLKDDGVSGELDSLYLYFAGPGQLNDPLEGYKDLFFDGDNIAWHNLLRNYLQCLMSHCIRMSFRPDETYDLSEQILDIVANAPIEVQSTFNTIWENFLSEPIILKFVATWPALGKASRSELFNYLDVIHLHALGVITQTLQQIGFLPSSGELDKHKHAQRLLRIKLYTEAFSEPGLDLNGKKNLTDRYFQSAREQQLLDRYRSYGRGGAPTLFYEMVAFPDKYCSALEAAVYPEWYVACFMEDCDDSSIWGTYGQNHTAVCLEFQVERQSERFGMTLSRPSSYSSERYEWSKGFMPFRTVSYDKEFASVDFFNSLGGLSIPNIFEYWLSDSSGVMSSRAKQLTEDVDGWRRQYWEGFEHSATVKISHWAKEREYRIIHSSGLFDLADPSMRKLTYDFSSLRGIVFGINTSAEDKCKIISKIEKLCFEYKREDFNFYQARYDHSSKKIDRDLLTTIKVGYQEVASKN